MQGEEITGMKHAIVIAIAIVIAAPAWAADTAARLNAQELARIQSGAPAAMGAPAIAPPVAVASSCPPGYRWVQGGYIRRGKWRDPGCVRLR
jgi:hypothetical protein